MNASGMPIDLLRLIIKDWMDLDGDRIFIYNPKYNLPTDNDIFVIIQPITSQIYANRNLPVFDVTMSETISVNTKETITVSILSRGLGALQRKEEVMQSLVSVYSTNLQETNSFKIAQIGTIQNVSELENTALLYRFDISVVILAWYTKTKLTAWYDSYSARVLVNDGDPLIEKTFQQPTSLPIT